jgi:hypothetical protein
MVARNVPRKTRRWLGNELQIPIIAAGTAEALHAIQCDDQLANRFEPIAVPLSDSGHVTAVGVLPERFARS